MNRTALKAAAAACAGFGSVLVFVGVRFLTLWALLPGLLMVGILTAIVVYLEETAEPRVSLADCRCPRLVRYGPEAADPRTHRYGCPYRGGWEEDRIPAPPRNFFRGR